MTDYIFESLGQAWVFGLREAMERGDIVEDEQVNLRDISLDESHDLLSQYKSKSDDTKLHLKLKEVLGYSVTIENASPDDPTIKEFANQRESIIQEKDMAEIVVRMVTVSLSIVRMGRMLIPS